MDIIKDKITKERVDELAKARYGDLVKVTLDIEQEIMAIGGDFHAQMEEVLMRDEGSKRENTWGINIYPDENYMIEFDSIINLKPFLDNKERDIKNEKVRNKIEEIVRKLII